MNNEVVIQINDVCKVFECAFRDGISEKLFQQLSEIERNPGWSISYGVNLRKGGLDKSIVDIGYNKAKDAVDATKNLESLLKDILGFRTILWKRNIDYGTQGEN